MLIQVQKDFVSIFEEPGVFDTFPAADTLSPEALAKYGDSVIELNHNVIEQNAVENIYNVLLLCKFFTFTSLETIMQKAQEKIDAATESTFRLPGPGDSSASEFDF